VNPFEATNRQLRKENVHAMLEFLTPRERKIIEMRFGLKTASAHAGGIGKEFGVTRERIRQIEAKVLQKMRDHPRSLTIREHGGAPSASASTPSTPSPPARRAPTATWAASSRSSRMGSKWRNAIIARRNFLSEPLEIRP